MRLNLSSDKEEASISTADEEKTSSAFKEGPTKEDSRAWRCTAEKSWDERPLTESTVRKKLSLLPEGIKVTVGAGDEARVEVLEPPTRLPAWVTLTILMSTRHDPIASAVYRQNMGIVDDEDNLRDSGANDTSALPTKLKIGGGLS